MVEEEVGRQRLAMHHRMVGDLASRENDSHLPSP
jgi:hypothetical protein